MGLNPRDVNNESRIIKCFDYKVASPRSNGRDKSRKEEGRGKAQVNECGYQGLNEVSGGNRGSRAEEY